MMKWEKKGVIFAPDNNYDFMASHAQVPFAEKISEELIRVYFATRDRSNRTVTGCLDLEADDPFKIVKLYEKPVLGLGRRGCCDDLGAMPSWIVNHGGRKYLYYTGWNVTPTVSYVLSIFVAVWDEAQRRFVRLSEGPVMARSFAEPYWCAQPSVLVEEGRWRMWYLSCTGWEMIHDHPEPLYLVKYAESTDGVTWRPTGDVCIGYDDFTSAVGRPCVLKEEGIYKMFYSYRNARDYRVDKRQGYRLGYAESPDGLTWTRKDDRIGITTSDSGWDSEMIEYCHVLQHGERKYMFYNGNGFGRSGFGLAVLS